MTFEPSSIANIYTTNTEVKIFATSGFEKILVSGASERLILPNGTRQSNVPVNRFPRVVHPNTST
jgi:hypothetical protein